DRVGAMTPRIPTAPDRTIALAIIPRHRRRLICIATHPDHLQPMRDALAEHTGDYRLSWHDEARRHVVCHEVRERGVVTRWDRAHAYRPGSERLHEVEAKAEAFEPMDAWRAAA